MSLTTRCPNCGTAFRVQPAQLSARGGKVRCGRCANVFDGVAALIQEGAATNENAWFLSFTSTNSPGENGPRPRGPSRNASCTAKSSCEFGKGSGRSKTA